jgi:tight adherence protein C
MDIWLVGFVSAAFISAAGITFAVGHLAASRSRLQRRLPAGSRMSGALTPIPGDSMGALMGEPFTEGVLGISQKVSKELRLKLVRAGYFSRHAIRLYVFLRICAVIVVPSLVLLSCALLFRDLSTLTFTLAAAAAVGVGVLGPDAYLARRQSWQIAEYRVNFPDLLDLLTVCVTAGLTVEASFERIRDRLTKRSRALGLNIGLMGAEMRAGRSSVDALGAFADRLGLD